MLSKIRFNKNLLNKLKQQFPKSSWKNVAQILFILLMVVLGILFFKHERAELSEVRNILKHVRLTYILFGMLIAGCYILLQGYMYVYSFKTLNERVSLRLLISLFLKRNFLSVFIPSGGVTSLAFFTSDVEQRGISKSKIYLASAIYGFIGVLTVVLAAIPGFGYALLAGEKIGVSELIGLLLLIFLLVVFVFASRSIMQKGWLYQRLVNHFPKTEIFLNELLRDSINNRYMIMTVIISLLIDFLGIFLLYIAMLAFGLKASLLIATIGYLIATISLIISPFMRGLGAVEVSMILVFSQLGLKGVDAIAVTFFYRFFEFWIPLIAGALCLLQRAHYLLFRIIPTLLLLVLGVVNIISVFVSPINERLIQLQSFIPMSAINTSANFVLIAGIFLIIIAAFMIRGFKSAWWIALFLCLISAIGHLIKGMDYEESAIALFVIFVLYSSRKEYYVKTDSHFNRIGVMAGLVIISCILIYGVTGFYYWNKIRDGIEFSLQEYMCQVLRIFFWLGSPDDPAINDWVRFFITSIKISGALSFFFGLYLLFKPYVLHSDTTIEQKREALDLVKKFGKSALDYFKTYPDKLIFKPNSVEAFLSYRVARNYAVVLELPVGKDGTEISRCIDQFEVYCMNNGMRSFYYRLPESALSLFKQKGKNTFFLGQEGIVHINHFNLEGGERKPIRNAVNKLISIGYKVSVFTPPLSDSILQKLKNVSEEWLKDTQREEIIFSQGMFLWDELKHQTIISVVSPEEKIVAFMNIIPDYASQETTYDLIRKTKDAPNGSLDFMMIEYFKYARQQGYLYVNMGLAPLSGMSGDRNLTERSLKFVYDKLHFFAEYHGLREYKEKFDPEWKNIYLTYDQDYDLLQFPQILTRVIKANIFTKQIGSFYFF